MPSLNKVTIIGHLGQDPEIRSFQSGDRVANFSVATSEKWKNKSGEKQERTEWHKVSVLNQPLVGIIEKYLKKGMLVYLEGQLETRKWDKDGTTHYTTEIVLRPYSGEMKMFGGGKDQDEPAQTQAQAAPVVEIPEDDLPF